MTAHRFLDPMAPARTFAARRAGMTDGRKLRRELQRLKRRVAPSFGGEDVPAEWSMIEEVDELPEADDDTIGRIFVKKNSDAEDVIEVGLTNADGEPILVGLNTLGDTNAIDLTLATAFDTVALESLGVAVDTSGNVWVSDFGLHRIYKYSPAGTILSTYGTSGSGNGQLNRPIGLAFDAGGNLYVADSGNNRVQKFTSTFAYVSQFGTAGTGDGQYQEPHGIAIDRTSGKIYVSDAGLNKVEVYNSSHVRQYTIGGTSGTAAGEFNGPVGLAIDAASGSLYVADRFNDRVQIFDVAGAYLSEIGSGNGNADGQFDRPSDVDIDANGLVYVADNGNSRVQVFSGGSYVAKFGTSGTASGELDNPSSIAIDVADGIAYVIDQSDGRVSSLAADNHGHTPIITTRTNTVSISGSGNNDGEATASCSVGEVVTGGGCSNETNDSANFVVTDSAPSGQGWRCRWRNANTGVTTTGKAWAVCMATPI